MDQMAQPHLGFSAPPLSMSLLGFALAAEAPPVDRKNHGPKLISNNTNNKVEQTSSSPKHL